MEFFACNYEFKYEFLVLWSLIQTIKHIILLSYFSHSQIYQYFIIIIISEVIMKLLHDYGI